MVRQKLITLMGIMLVMALYFWGHNVGESALTIRNGLTSTTLIAFDIGIVFALVMVTGAIGRRVLSVMDFSVLSIGERVAIDSLLGLGIISLIAVTLGLLGQFNLLIWG
ncbi:MAG: hypothetical protein AAFV93_23960, partial [Chloroflexota bacterium]